MINHNDHDDHSDDEVISFKVETADAPGAPVFAASESDENFEIAHENALVSDLVLDEVLSSQVEITARDSQESSPAVDDTASEESLQNMEMSPEMPTEMASELSVDDSQSLSSDEDSSEAVAFAPSALAADPESGEEPQEVDHSLGLVEDLSLIGKIEAIIFASPKPLRTVEIHELLMEQGFTLKEIQDALDEMLEFFRDRGGGFHLKYVKRMGYQFQTTTAAKSLMEKQFSSRPRPLSRAALETLAVIAYRQKVSKGVTRAEVEFIRGVDAGSIFKTLMERNLLTCTGRKEIPGRPMMFGVTDEFLKVFQLGSINDLPPLESFQTPADVIAHANEKIQEFENEQAGVDPEEFIGDEEYTEDLGEAQFNPLEADAPTFAVSPQLVEQAAALEPIGGAEVAVPLFILDEVREHLSAKQDQDMSAADDESAVEMGDVQEVVEIVPLKSASDTVLSVLDDGRTITGASLASFDHESEDEWGEETSSIVAPAADIVEERSIEGAWLADAGSEHEDTGLDPVSLEPLPSELKPDEEGNYSAPDTACSEKSQ